MFQSTHPRGVRHFAVATTCRNNKFQSTHPRGVRLSIDEPIDLAEEFQSTHPRGVRLEWLGHYICTLKFQSTHPRGVRRLFSLKNKPERRFNPRTHEGCDTFESLCGTSFNVSIHAPTRGATLYPPLQRYHFYVSIHAPTRGATYLSFFTLLRNVVSIHAPTRGATSPYISMRFSRLSFNPRTHEGCDCRLYKLLIYM